MVTSPPAALPQPPAAARPETPELPADAQPPSEAEGQGEVSTPEAGEAQDAVPDLARQLIVIDAAPYGIQAVVGQHTSHQLRATGQAMGYTVLPPDATVQAAQHMRMPYPPTPADLWRVTYATRSHRGVFARVWAQGGKYVVEVTVASMDGTGPFYARGEAGADDLRPVVDRLLREALPPPSLWQEGGAAAQAGTAPEQPVPPPPTPAAPGSAGSLIQAPPAPRPPPPPSPPLAHHWRLVAQTEAAFGTSDDSFYNHLAGMRLDYRISQRMALGAYLGYANLRGKGGRVGNLLPYLMGEHRVRVVSSSDLTIPLRVAVGYLPFNGPVVRLAAGLNIPLSDRVELGFDIITPTFWVLPDRTAFSLDLGLELGFHL